MWSRIHLIPLLQAEEDRDVVRRVLGQKKMEKELLGKEMPVYNKDVYVQSISCCPEVHRYANASQLRAADLCSNTVQRDEIEPGRSSIVQRICVMYIHTQEFGGLAWPAWLQRDECYACFICYATPMLPGRRNPIRDTHALLTVNRTARQTHPRSPKAQRLCRLNCLYAGFRAAHRQRQCSEGL